MYLPGHFAQHEAAALAALMREHPLATLVVHGEAGLLANHLPLLFDPAAGPHGTLRGHVARANPLWRTLGAGADALAIFHGPQAYVTPTWYPSKRDGGKVVPTWNYAVVHAHGRLTAIDDAAWLRGFVAALTRVHEASRSPAWDIADAPPEFIERMVESIVGIELAVTRLAGKWKVSQNRSAADRDGVVRGLREDSLDAMAVLVERG